MIKLIKPLLLSFALFLLVYITISAQSVLTVTVNDLSYGGFLFLNRSGKDSCIVTDLPGNILFEYQLSSRCADFKRLDGGDWIYFDRDNTIWKRHTPYSHTVKATYSISDSENDGHDIIVTDDYVWLMGRKDFLAISGTLAFTLRGTTLQKQDLSGKVLFDWQSWGYIGIDEATLDLLARPNMSFPHSNAFYEDVDGNLLVSLRNTNSVVKVCVTGDNCQTGGIIWRLGGLQSDFVFVNDRGIAKQHSVIMADKCHGGVDRCLLLFDNGNDFEPQYSRAVEYVLDEAQGLVTKTWEYTADGQIYAFATGNVKRLDNGDTVIGWGRARQDDPNAPTVTVVDWQGNVKYEAALGEGITSYRAHLYPEWRRYLPLVAK